MQRVDFDELELDLYDRKTYSWRGRRFTGIAYGLRPDGTLWDEITFADGRKHGLTRQWHPSGRIENETAYFKGTTYGPDREWDEAGALTLDYERGADHPNHALLQKYRAAYDKFLGQDPR